MSPVSETELAAASESISLDDVIDTNALRLRWDNSVRYQVSRQLLFLRRAQKLRQAQVAKAAGTSQPAIARIESGEENITLDTLERLVNAMNGRFSVSIPPADHVFPQLPDWWDDPAPAAEHGPWYLRFAMGNQDSMGRHVVLGLSQPNTQPSPELLTLEEAK